MNLLQTAVLTLSVLSSNIAMANSDNGKQLFNKHCASCHGLSGGMDMSKRLAPPMAGVRRHYIGTYPDEFTFVNAITDWVASPDKNKTQMRGAIRRFGLMPKISVSSADIEKIATYIFEGKIEAPAGFAEHERKMHGKH